MYKILKSNVKQQIFLKKSIPTGKIGIKLYVQYGNNADLMPWV